MKRTTSPPPDPLVPPPLPQCSALRPVWFYCFHDDDAVDDDDDGDAHDDDDQALKGGEGRAVGVNLFQREKFLLEPHGHLFA